MDVTSLVVFVHVLAFVFWLGADIGVFILGKFAQKTEFSVETRMTLLQVAMIIDKFPRVSMVAALASGFYLSLTSGWLILPTAVVLPVWLALGVWFVAIAARVRAAQPPHWVELTEKYLHYLFLVFFIALVVATAAGQVLVAGSWVFAKIGLFAVVLALALWLEKAFMPAVGGFMELAAEGSSPPLEQRIKTAMDSTYRSVIAIYVCTFLAALLGVVKPSLW